MPHRSQYSHFERERYRAVLFVSAGLEAIARIQASAGDKQARSIAEALSPTLRADTPASIDLPVIKGRKGEAAVVVPSISGSRAQLAQISPEQAGQGEAKRVSGKRVTKKQVATKKAKPVSNAQRIDDALAALENLRT
ncbi:hypothetical protein ACFDAU_01615 [Sulfuriferula sp. GW1]|uniref:hypothetical protein n=1 Tax=Sulfuriferula sp. GW1 TaxID=3345111 RepID=UPI0039AEB8EE